MSIITKRSELLFCYDIKDANPNGDPLDGNKPRIDEESGINIVTDVRLKRTIRDYLLNYKGYNGEKGKDIFVRELPSDQGTGIKDGKARAKDFSNNKEDVLESCIDVRLFGGVLPLEKDSITFTGPIQFQMGRSMHCVELKHIKGTGAFASKEGKEQSTFRDEYILPYSFISFYGIINENAAQETNLAESDVTVLMEGMWEGTKNLISRSKFGQLPRLLVKINYTDPGFFIGEINTFIKIDSKKRDEQLRSVADFSIDISKLKEVVSKNEHKIESIDYKVDTNVTFTNGESFESLLPGKMNELQF